MPGRITYNTYSRPNTKTIWLSERVEFLPDFRTTTITTGEAFSTADEPTITRVRDVQVIANKKIRCTVKQNENTLISELNYAKNITVYDENGTPYTVRLADPIVFTQYENTQDYQIQIVFYVTSVDSQTVYNLFDFTGTYNTLTLVVTGESNLVLKTIFTPKPLKTEPKLYQNTALEIKINNRVVDFDAFSVRMYLTDTELNNLKKYAFRLVPTSSKLTIDSTNYNIVEYIESVKVNDKGLININEVDIVVKYQKNATNLF